MWIQIPRTGNICLKSKQDIWDHSHGLRQSPGRKKRSRGWDLMPIYDPQALEQFRKAATGGRPSARSFSVDACPAFPTAYRRARSPSLRPSSPSSSLKESKATGGSSGGEKKSSPIPWLVQHLKEDIQNIVFGQFHNSQEDTTVKPDPKIPKSRRMSRSKGGDSSEKGESSSSDKDGEASQPKQSSHQTQTKSFLDFSQNFHPNCQQSSIGTHHMSGFITSCQSGARNSIEQRIPPILLEKEEDDYDEEADDRITSQRSSEVDTPLQKVTFGLEFSNENETASRRFVEACLRNFFIRFNFSSSVFFFVFLCFWSMMMFWQWWFLVLLITTQKIPENPEKILRSRELEKLVGNVGSKKCSQNDISFNGLWIFQKIFKSLDQRFSNFFSESRNSQTRFLWRRFIFFIRSLIWLRNSGLCSLRCPFLRGQHTMSLGRIFTTVSWCLSREVIAVVMMTTTTTMTSMMTSILVMMMLVTMAGRWWWRWLCCRSYSGHVSFDRMQRTVKQGSKHKNFDWCLTE